MYEKNRGTTSTHNSGRSKEPLLFSLCRLCLLPLQKLKPLHAVQVLLAFRFEVATSSHSEVMLVARVTQQSVCFECIHRSPEQMMT